MAGEDDYRNQFDRFAQDRYLKILLNTDEDSIIPTLFLDVMNRVNMLEGQAGLVLAEVEHAHEENTPVEEEFMAQRAIKILGGAVDISNILKALMEYYEIRQKNKNSK
ncbi:MAG: hypothetical protein ACOYL5_03125 [Phototrophicaceae bacterium]|jgi:hypothetical protein